jgi:hypothetical protein
MIITEDGIYEPTHVAPGTTGGSMVIYASGVFGGATVKLQYRNGLGSYIDIADGVLVEGSETIASKGIGMPIYIAVTGTTGTSQISIITAVLP